MAACASSKIAMSSGEKRRKSRLPPSSAKTPWSFGIWFVPVGGWENHSGIELEFWVQFHHYKHSNCLQFKVSSSILWFSTKPLRAQKMAFQHISRGFMEFAEMCVRGGWRSPKDPPRCWSHSQQAQVQQRPPPWFEMAGVRAGDKAKKEHSMWQIFCLSTIWHQKVTTSSPSNPLKMKGCIAI